MPRPKQWTDIKKEKLKKHLHLSNERLAVLMETTVQMIKKMKNKWGFRKSYHSNK